MNSDLSGGSRLGHDEVFSTLSNARRRHALAVLKRSDAPVTIRVLSERVAARENGCRVDDVTARQRKRVYTALHQTHLPKMDALGIVVYDADRGTVTLTDAVAELDVYLQVVPRRALTGSELSLVMAAAATALVVTAWLDVLPLSDLLVATIVVTAFLATAVVHAYAENRVRIETLLGADGPDAE